MLIRRKQKTSWIVRKCACYIGRALMDYLIELARQSGIKSIRLDVYENNLPAISLYENCGFEHIDTVDLGFSNYGLN